MGKDNPLEVADNSDWLTERRGDGFESLKSGYQRLWRFRYPEELLHRTDLDEQARALGDWIVESFRLLTYHPPPK